MSSTAKGRLDGLEIIAIEHSLALAQQFVRDGVRWHHHVLFPGCTHNVFDTHALVIENDDDHRAYYAPSDSFPEVDKDLVRMLHGDDILDAGSTESAGGRPVTSPLVQRARELADVQAAWHHHMCFPSCAVNPVPGRWTIVVESGADEWTDDFDDEPVDVLREIEVLFFRTTSST